MVESSPEELRRQLRGLLPATLWAGFDEDVDLFGNDSDGVSYCGVLTAFSWAFDRCLAAGHSEAIIQALDLLEHLLAASGPPLPGDDLANGILTCFFENVLPTTPQVHPLVIPHLGVTVRRHIERYSPSWLLPDPNARLNV